MARDTLALEAMAGMVLEDKYRLVRILGSGAMAHVYEAEQVRLGRSVAVKIMRVALASDRRSLERFRTEALAASRINHPNAIAIYDVGVTKDGIPFMVMEHLRGTTLAGALATQRFPVDRIVNVGAQILSALEEAHGCGVIHRDLKSENVVLEPRRDGTDFVKVLDFGIAAFIGSADQSIVGTPEYMAPEQIRGEPPRPATDLYAMGIMLYEMIVGQTPFAGAPLSVLLERHLSDSPKPPHEVIDECPIQLSDVVMQALAKDPDRRFSDASEMREALLAVVGGTRRACRSCGTRILTGMRFCSGCGVDLNEPPRSTEPVPRVTLAFGSGPVAGKRRTDKPRPTRLTFDLSVDTGALVGRADALADIGAWLTAPEADARPLAVIGSPGVGKARLVLEAMRGRATDAVTFVAAPDPTGHQLSWYPVLSMLEAILGLPARPSYEDISKALGQVGTPRDAPGLAELFAVAGPLSSLELAVRRRETFAAAVRALTAAAQRFNSPVLCFVDVDRYDQPSRKLIELVAASPERSVRMIVTAASADAVPAGAEVLTLGGLEEAETHGFLARIIGAERAAAVEPHELHQMTGGLPAHVQHLAGWMALHNDIAEAPVRLVDLVSSRLTYLPSAARRLLQAIAAHGQVAARADLAALLGEIDPNGSALASLVRGGLVIAGPDEITIPLALVAQVADACTPAETRRALSAEILARHGGQLPLVIAAHHAEAAEDLERALADFIAAGDDAVRRFDDPRAAALYHRAVTIARRMQGAGDPRAAGDLVEASLRLADVLRYMGEIALAAGCLDEAEMFAPTPAQQAGILRARGRIALISGQTEQAVTLLQKSIGKAFRTGDVDFLNETYIDLAAALGTLGALVDAINELSEAVDALTLGEGLANAERPVRLWLLGLRLSHLHHRAGNMGAAKRVARDALAHAEKSGSIIGQGRLNATLATLCEQSGDTQAALSHQARALDLMRRLGDRRTTAELLLACARITGDVSTVPGGPRRRAVDLAQELAAEVGWDSSTS